MKKSKWQAIALLCVCGATALPLAPAAEARANHRHHRGRRVVRHRGEQTFPVIAGSESVRINSAGQVITDRHP